MEASIELLSQFTEGSAAKTTLQSALKSTSERSRGNEERETIGKRRTRTKQNLPANEILAGTTATVSSTLTTDAISVLVVNRNTKSEQLFKYLEEGKDTDTAAYKHLVAELTKADEQLGKVNEVMGKSSRTERQMAK